jgi:hypothetical protein
MERVQHHYLPNRTFVRLVRRPSLIPVMGHSSMNGELAQLRLLLERAQGVHELQ